MTYRIWKRGVAARAFVLLTTCCVLAALGACVPVTQVSTALLGGTQPDDESFDPSLSADGRYTAFASSATNLVANDTNAFKDIFLRDNQAGTTELISKAMGGGSANGVSGQPDISADGRYIIYWSYADDIVPSDTNLGADVFLYDVQAGTTERVSVDSSGGEASGDSLGGSVSDDGRFVTFYTTAALVTNDTNSDFDVYKRDRLTGTTTLISESTANMAAGQSYEPVMSPDGEWIIFYSGASDLVVGDTNGRTDVFGAYVSFPGFLFNFSSAGNGHSYSGDVIGGTFPAVVFHSSADNLVPGDNNGQTDVFMQLWDGGNFQLERLTDGDGGSFNAVIADTNALQGLYVACMSAATDLQEAGADPLDTNGVTDVYLWEKTPQTPVDGRTRLMSETGLGNLSNDHAVLKPAISGDGQAVSWASVATNLVSGGSSNGFRDVYLRPTWQPRIDSVSGSLVPGQTEVLTLAGEFRPGVSGDQVFVGGDGIVSQSASVQFSSLTVTVELAPSATPGPRDLVVYNDDPAIGINAPLGAAATVQVYVMP